MKRKYETFIDARKVCDVYVDNQQTLLRLIQIVVLKNIALIYCMDRVKPNKINSTEAIEMVKNLFPGGRAKSVKDEI